MFHYNTVLTLELASPYFSSGLREESFEVMVMEHKGDGHARSGNVAEIMLSSSIYRRLRNPIESDWLVHLHVC